MTAQQIKNALQDEVNTFPFQISREDFMTIALEDSPQEKTSAKPSS